MRKTKPVRELARNSGTIARKAAKHTARHGIRAAKKTAHLSKRVARTTHYHIAVRPHEALMQKSQHYSRWHTWRFHKHVHVAALSAHLFLVGLIVFNSVSVVFAADLSDNWDFGTPSDFTLDSGIETSGTSARLKAQEYTSDADTAALFHMNESSGTSITDSSSNNNTATANTAPTWGAGNMNNAATLDGTSQQISVPDSSSLSFTGQHSLEGWFKPTATFNSSSGQNMTILDKGNYKVGLDRSSGKLTYEATNSSAGNSWTRRLGNGLNGSWTHGHYATTAATSYGSDIYTGLGQAVGDAEVWKWNGTAWSQIGGDGLSGSWADQTYEEVTTLAVNGTALYAGLGTTAGDGEIWTCNLAASCSSWSKIGGDNNGPSSLIESIQSMVVHSGSLYIGTGITGNDGLVWKYNGGSSWTQVGGTAVNSSWNTGYESVRSLASDGTYLYAGLGDTATEAEVWRFNGTTWSQIGGDGLSGSWTTTFEYVRSMTWDGTYLYAGLGSGSGDGLIYRWNGSTWTQIGGSSLNGSWGGGGQANEIATMVWDGTYLYAGLYNSGAGLWRWNGSTWTQVAGGSVNGSWSSSIASPVVVANSKVYSGAWSTNIGSFFYEWSGTGNWTQIGGKFLNGGWGGARIGSVGSSAVHNSKLYFGVGTVASAVEVYEYNGATATRIGGGGLNGSWAANTYETVDSMISYKGKLYVGLGWNALDAELWSWNGSSWTKEAGDGLNGSWPGNDTVSSMAVLGDSLYVGTGRTSLHAGDLWRLTGSTWTQIGGDGLNNGWSTTIRNVPALTVFNNQICAGVELVSTPGFSGVWCWNGSTWTQIGGGTNLNGGWDASVSDAVGALASYNGNLYAGVAELNTTNSAVWKWNGSTWSKVGGASAGGSWADGTYSRISSMAVYNGLLYVGSGITSAGSGDVWRYDGTSWSQVAGDGLNGAWAANTIEGVSTLTPFKGKLYAGTGTTVDVDASVWSMGDNTYLESTTTSFDNGWHHFAASSGSGVSKLYIDGTQEASGGSSNTTDTNIPLLIGSGYGSNNAGESQGFFAGSLDEIRLSNSARSSFTTKPYANTAQSIVLNSAVRTTGVDHWDGLAAGETANGGTIKYRLSDDAGATWKYWTGSAWGASNSVSDTNTIGTINTNIATFPVTFNGIKWQAVLTGDGTQRVQLDSVTLSATSDVNGPDTNATNITALKANAGSSLGSNEWTNGASPYFSWDAATDGGAGVLGYCLYLGQTASADPATTKGMLGTGTANTGGNCPFAVSSTNLDLATAGLLGTALSSSSDPYYLRIKAIDNAGNLFATAEQFQFRFDNTAPSNPGFISAPSGFLNSKAATLTWPTSGGQAASDNNSGVIGLQYRIGASGTWYGDSHTGSGNTSDLLNNDGSYDTVDPTDYDNLSDGINTIYFRTWDEAGNVTTNYVTAALKINTSGAPTPPQNLTADPSTNTTNEFSFDWDAPSTFNTTTGNADKLSYCYTVNTLPTVNSCNYTSQGQTSIGPSAFATQPGDNTFYVVGKDDFGAINYSSLASVTFTANTSAPGIPTNADVVDVSIKANSNWRLAITWDQPSTLGAGIAQYRVMRSTDNSNFTQIGTSTSASYVDTGLSQQEYFYKVKACDSANNCGAESTVVSETPTGKFTSPASQTSDAVVSEITTKRATIAWNTDRASDSKIQIGTTSGEYSASEIGNSSQVSAHKLELDNLAAGTTYYFKARWTDEDGNTGTSQEYTFTTAPAPVLKEVQSLKVNLSGATIQFTVKDAVKVNFIYGKSDSFGGVKAINTSMSESTYSTSLDGLDDGTKYFYRIIMFDSEGGEYQSSIFSLTTPQRPRVANLRFQPVAGEPTSTQQITWTTNIPTNSIVTYGKSGSNGIDVSLNELKTSHEMIIKGLEDNSEYFLLAQGRDADGNLATSDRQSFKTALDTRPPKVTAITIEPTVRGSGAEARGQIVVSWKTDEPSTSQVAFAEGSNATEFNSRTAEDAALTTDHIVIISDLPTSKVYTIKPISKDRSGNAGQGENQPSIIGRASDSVLNIVLNTLRKVFGF